MSFLFGSSKSPATVKTVQAPSVPSSYNVPTQEAATEEEKKKLTQGRKKRSTLLTGPRGILEPANVLKQKLGE